MYNPIYKNSWALVVGINSYQHTSPLGYAKQDAQAIAEVLTTKLEFPNDNVQLLLEGDASRNRIMSSFVRFAEEHVHPDDRIVFFFAGHGFTKKGHRGEIGYLVPQDGNSKDLSTLIRWDELTGNGELISAKHMVFLMDACYGGLAVSRSLPPGSSRFLKDMLKRYSRQVLTAGKADEVVADVGGPRSGHSIFTGHLLEALEGAAEISDGIISANAVMAHVYDRVSKDQHSHQSPHYGFIDGDGDLIFKAPNLASLSVEPEVDKDVLIHIPANVSVPTANAQEQSFTNLVKDYLSDSRYRIRLDDLVAAEVRAVLENTREEFFPVSTATVTPEDFAERLRRYESTTHRLSELTVLLARWGTSELQGTLDKILTRIADANDQRGGSVVWLGLRWYPLTLLMYSGGIAALSARNYENLATLFTTRLGAHITGEDSTEALVVAVKGMLEIQRTDCFKLLPGHEKNYVPKSEYLFKVIQPVVDDLLFLGNSYEDLFDRFEVFQALVHADLRARDSKSFWGPPGRFAYKHRGPFHNPFEAIVQEAEQHGKNWSPLQSGLFAGSIERFREVVVEYRKLLSSLNWF